MPESVAQPPASGAIASGSAAPGPRLGLSASEAQQRLQTEGYNELPRQRARSLREVIVEVFREPMVRLLLAAGLVYVAVGDLGEALLLLLFAAFSVAITIIQQARTERTLDALRDLSSPRALVIRDGEQRRIAGREVVRGDLLVLSEGDRVAADAQLIDALDLGADESLLTGESVPVGKTAAPDTTVEPRPGGDGQPFVFAGTLIVRGRGLAEVRATGAHTEMGRIGTLLTTIGEETTPLAAQLRRVVRWMATAGLGVSAAVALIYGLTRGDWLQGVLAGIALAMSLLPEEFPLVLSIFLTLGARRMARRRVLSRRTACIEALGAASVLCVDKTGTLTLNRMTVAELRIDGNSHTVGAGAEPPAFARLARTAAMACAAHPTDPMEKAIVALLSTAPPGRLVHEYGLSPELLAMSQVWTGAEEGRYIVATKGAPETVAELCRLSDARRAAVRAEVEDMARRGMRVLAVAEADFAGARWPASQREFSLRFAGLIGLADPLRPNVPQAIRDCRAAGIRVVMLTGDFPATARAIADQAGLDDAGAVLTGGDIDALGDAQLRERLAGVSVCARVMPKHKLRVVEALKGAGEIVAMTGDGVNDAPSLRAAHIGIAMGGRGTDVAREAAGIVLLDDEFGAIVEAVHLGRRIYDNIRKAMGYVLAVHVLIAGVALAPLLFGWPIILGPVHIAFLEFIIDPVCSIAFEAEPAEGSAMKRPPRPRDEPLLSRRLIVWSLLQGVFGLALILGFHAAFLDFGLPEADARAMSFVSMVAVNVVLIFVNRSFSNSLLDFIRRPNTILWRGLLALTALLSAILGVPFLRQLFGFGSLHGDDLLLSAVAGLILFGGLEAAKRRLSPLAGRDSSRHD